MASRVTTMFAARPRPSNFTPARRASRLHGLSLGIAVTVLLVIGQILAQTIDFGVYQLRFGPLDSNSHASIFGVASLAAQALATLAAAARIGTAARPMRWIALSVLTTLVLALRVAVSFRAGLLLGPVAVLFVLLWYVPADDPKPGPAVVRAGLAALVFSYVVHVLGPHVVAALGYGGDTWPYQVKGLLKHSAELGGWMLVAVGIYHGRPPRGEPR